MGSTVPWLASWGLHTDCSRFAGWQPLCPHKNLSSMELRTRMATFMSVPEPKINGTQDGNLMSAPEPKFNGTQDGNLFVRTRT
ncbi:hypothetical protein RRG08_025383 [Elysia crispata]|uniref:Uncharacterized protein n=1 Tax=Elysia crispata TaxID=231223 RepID=A0AAE1EBD1_9GAST|nr:hypothetical protein RRG08_025383 [Elysia crispata]